MNSKDLISQLVEAKKELFIGVSDSLWENPEVGFKEFQSAATLIQALKQEGFEVEEGLLLQSCVWLRKTGHRVSG